MGLFDDALEGLRRMSKREGNPTRLAEKLGEKPNLFSRWFDGTRKPSWDKLSSILEKVGARLVFPDEECPPPTVVQIADPLSQRVEIITRTLRDANVAELEILRAVRSMLDAEIAKAQASYGTREPGPGLAMAAEDAAQYNAEKKEP